MSLFINLLLVFSLKMYISYFKIKFDIEYYNYYYGLVECMCAPGCMRKLPEVEFERNAVQGQLQETRRQLKELQDQLLSLRTTCSNSYSETAMMKLHVDSVEHRLQSVSRLTSNK